MRMTQRIVLSSLTAIALLTSGCGDSSSESSDTPTTPDAMQSSTITVERGPILGATVVDANGTEAIELENGQYVFNQAIEYPITSTGGYIDVNRNGTIDAGELENKLTLVTTDGDVVTLATTLSSNEELKAVLVDELGIESKTINEELPDTDTAIEALSDEVFKYALENNISDPSQITVEELTQIGEEYKNRYQMYLQDDLDAKEHEANLIDSMSIITLDDAEATAVQEEIQNRFQNTHGSIDFNGTVEGDDKEVHVEVGIHGDANVNFNNEDENETAPSNKPEEIQTPNDEGMNHSDNGAGTTESDDDNKSSSSEEQHEGSGNETTQSNTNGGTDFTNRNF